MKPETPVNYVKGVGPKIAEKLAKLGVQTLSDFLQLYPRRYVDYTSPYCIAEAPFDTDSVVLATIHSKGTPVRLPGGRTRVQVMAFDDSASLSLVWFNTHFAADSLKVGQTYYLEGKVQGSFTRREMINPIVRTPAQVNISPILPIYPQTEGLGSRQIARLMQNALEVSDPLPEPLPPELLKKYRMPDKWTAVRNIHQPKSQADSDSARRRLIFEELFTLQLGLLLLRSRDSTETGAPMRSVDLEPFWASLPYSPTGAQRRAANEICTDMCGKAPMNRLLQGDVGSGKTLVAASAAYIAHQNGWQTVLMAPTEVLAKQHAASLQQMLGPFGINVALLSGGMKAAPRRTALSAISRGDANLIVGTHAVIGQNVEFARLGLVIVDEQHRFGVRQRGLLADKAQHPHILVMSATPIPRTLGLLLYGDLDISILDELPPGRQPVKTRAVTGKKRQAMYGFLNSEIEAGHQIYIVCPRVEEGETEADSASEIQSVKRYYTDVAQALLPGRRVGLMHGRLKPSEKESVMTEFKEGRLDALVSTTVIEVGVDVPNATVMVIENAERYGLSALHQLRGRVGRGSSESWCFLVSDHEGRSVTDRLHFLCHTLDGFEIAKYDLENRGPGDFFGSRQHGLPTLRLADLSTDSRTLEAAQKSARELLHLDPALKSSKNQVLADQVNRLFSRATLN